MRARDKHTRGAGVKVVSVLREQIEACAYPFQGFLGTEDILALCREVGHRFRKRMLDPVITVWAMIFQALSADHSCRQAVRCLQALVAAMGPGVTSRVEKAEVSTYCHARMRLPLELLSRLVRLVAQRVEAKAGRTWHGLRVLLVDGTSFSMPDTPTLQERWPQPKGQKVGCGFPVAYVTGILSLFTGVVLGWEVSNKHENDQTRFRRLWSFLGSGDLMLGDRGFCGYAPMALLLAQGAHSLFRLHHRRNPRDGLIRQLGERDWLVRWTRPIRVPWLPEADSLLPPALDVRLIWHEIAVRGFRTQHLWLATTLLDAQAFPAEEIAALYGYRWKIEGDFRHLKGVLGMDVLRSKTPALIEREMWSVLLTYNLVRGVQADVSREFHEEIAQLSIKGTIQNLRVFAVVFTRQPARLQRAALRSLHTLIASDPVPERPNRHEPRARKRRPKPYSLLNRPRAELRKEAEDAA